MLKLKRIKNVRNIMLSRPYMNSEIAVLTLGEAELRGKIFLGVRKHPCLRDDDTELMLFMRQDSETRLHALLRQILPGWNIPHTGIIQLDEVKPARMFGEIITGQFRWRDFVRGALQTREEVKARLQSLGLDPQTVDCVFPPTKSEREV